MDNKTKQRLRQKLLINREVQGALIIRNVVHWCFYMAAILLVVSIWTSFHTPSGGPTAIELVFESFVYFSPAILASMLLMPLFIYDHLKASHKVAGPIFRLQTEMQKLIDGEEVQELRFRDGDHWAALAKDFSKLAEIVNENRRQDQLEQEADEEAKLENDAKDAMATSEELKVTEQADTETIA